MHTAILTASTVLPMSSPPIHGGAVLISGSSILEVGKETELRKRHPTLPTFKLGRGTLMPGLINAHTHLELGWTRAYIGYFGSFTGWISQMVRAKRHEVLPEEIQASVQEGVRSLISSGVTTVGEISSFGGLDKPILRNSGLRTVLFFELFDRNEDLLRTVQFESAPLFEKRPFPHAPYSCTPAFLKKITSFYENHGVPFGIHLAESRDEVRFLRGESNGFEKSVFPLIGKDTFMRQVRDTPFEYMKNIGFFNGTRSTLVHMVHVKDSEVDELAEHEAGVVLCPRSNAFLRVGHPPVASLSRLKRIGLGTDGLSSNYNLDMLEEMRYLHSISSKPLRRRAAYFTVYAATLGGARALFIEEHTGSLEPGKDADIIFLSPEHHSRDPYMSVLSSSSEDVHLVMVAGRVIHSKLKSLSP